MSVVVKTSDGTCVPADSSLPAEYAAATDGSQLVQSVLQMYSYLGAVPYGVLVTDKQLFCMRREGTELFCSPAIPITGYVDCPAEDGRGGSSAADQQAATGAAEVAQEQLQAAGGRSAGSLTAVAALYCIMRMSQRWWAQQPPPPPPQQLAGAEGKGNSGGGAELVPAAAAAPGAAAGPALPHAAADGSWSSSQLFPFGLDPRVPGGVPPSLGAACMGCVLQGSVGGRPAAVKLVDLWKVPEGREVLQVRSVVHWLAKVVGCSSRLCSVLWVVCGPWSSVLGSCACARPAILFRHLVSCCPVILHHQGKLLDLDLVMLAPQSPSFVSTSLPLVLLLV